MKYLAVLVLVTANRLAAADLEWVRVADDQRSFVFEQSGERFTPWGFNYDHDQSGRLIEDYWEDEWATIEEDFREMKALGANVVRIHLQFGKFMDGPAQPNRHSLEQLRRLVRLANDTGLYLDLTGLGCYHKKDVPAWYDRLDENDRWEAQARFWEAIARECVDRPAVFCYDLMNEPVVPGGRGKRDDWLGPAFAGKHFVQFVTLETKGRARPAIAKEWTRHLVTAIRTHDRRHLVTVGLVPWSLNRPGLTSGFVPTEIVDELDFICVHIYPEQGAVDQARKTLAGFSVGKPVVIEEMFPLKCSAQELGKFIDASKEHASGWIGFYWGKKPAELRTMKTIPAALTANWLELFKKKAKEIER